MFGQYDKSSLEGIGMVALKEVIYGRKDVL